MPFIRDTGSIRYISNQDSIPPYWGKHLRHVRITVRRTFCLFMVLYIEFSEILCGVASIKKGTVPVRTRISTSSRYVLQKSGNRLSELTQWVLV